jgi:hypothetical protein
MNGPFFCPNCRTTLTSLESVWLVKEDTVNGGWRALQFANNVPTGRETQTFKTLDEAAAVARSLKFFWVGEK